MIAKKKLKKIIHIDYGSNGTAGLYLDQILKAYSGPIPVDAYTHSNFPNSAAKVKIYRLFDQISKFTLNKNLKKIIKIIELYIIFIYLVLIIKNDSKKYKLYVFVQFFQSFHAYKFLFNLIKKNCTLIVTVHDAIELNHNYPSIIMSKRDDIISNANIIVVHNNDSINKLKYIGKKIYKIPFPLMLNNKEELFAISKMDKVQFLFIGHLRLEKGLDELIKAWRKLPSNILDRACLTIAGNYNFDLNLNFDNLKNCTLILEYLDDEKFVHLIKTSHYILLPYTGGTNSGVLSMCSALGRPSITTKLPIFTESPFFEELLAFESHSELDKLIIQTIINHHRDYDNYLIRNNARLNIFQTEFDLKIKELYEKILFK